MKKPTKYKDLKKKLKVKYSDDGTTAYLKYKDTGDTYEIQVGPYEGKLPRIWISDYNPATEVTVPLYDSEYNDGALVNPLNKHTRRGAVVELAIEIHEKLKHINFRYSYF